MAEAYTGIPALLKRIRSEPGCSVEPPCGLPVVRREHRLTPDLVGFYGQCGGVTLFEDSASPLRIVPPVRVELANTVLLPELTEDEFSSCKNDITWSWYIIARGNGGECLTIDLDPLRWGRCYDSFWDRHGIAGSCRVVARSFTELLTRLMDNRGEHFYWLRPDFETLGDAYD